ncbi:MAG: transporter substrate-binding domain-containing protein [Quinella sp. 1Q7]|nr:transporter substrate-binding domain-containing protein [Quinella sp. 1Q7]
MKKIFILLMIFALVLMTGCGGSDGSKGGDKTSDANEVKVGMITHLNASEQKMGDIYNALVQKAGLHLAKYKPVFFDNLSTMQAGLDAGNVDQISTYNCVANYLTAANDKYAAVEDLKTVGLADSFCFAVRKDDAQLKSDLDKAIDAMKSDGTLDKLVAEYITNVKPDKIPKVDIPNVDGAETLKIGITGDLPPFDLVTADNSPAGFNTAMLAEIAKRLNRNVELVQIDSAARSSALASGQIDVIFWTIVPANADFPADIDKPEGVELSAPYFKDDVTHLKLKQ